jgi:CDP-glucose 4,6-dehydratase
VSSVDGLRGATALVTGAQGFIGSWLVARLLDEGARVVAPRRPAPPESLFARDGLERRCELAQLDLCDVSSLVRVLAELEVELVFHLAAQTIVGTASRAPLDALEVNVRGTYNLLEACRMVRGGRPDVRVVVASSYHVYGPHGGEPCSERADLRPQAPYDVSKACADMIARCYAATFDMPVAVTRLANVIGGGDVNFSRLIPAAARSLAAGERPVIRSDGTPEREYLHVEDAADAYLAVAASLERPELRGRAWNAGAYGPLSVLELVERLVAVSGTGLEPRVEGRPQPDAPPDRQVLDSSALRGLGWISRRPLDEALAESYAWYRRGPSP